MPKKKLAGDDRINPTNGSGTGCTNFNHYYHVIYAFANSFTTKQRTYQAGSQRTKPRWKGMFILMKFIETANCIGVGTRLTKLQQ